MTDKAFFIRIGRQDTSIQIHANDISRIFQMQRVNQSQTTQDIELKETQAISPDSIRHQESSLEVLPSQSGWRCYWKRCTFLAMLVLCSLMLGYEINASPANIQSGHAHAVGNQLTLQELERDFMAFCPATDEELHIYSLTDSGNNDLRRRVLAGGQSGYTARLEKNQASDYLKNRTYIVRAQSTSDKTLRYCGRARRLDENCSRSEPNLCLARPMFDVLVYQAIDIIWVNALNSNNQPQPDDCMEQDSSQNARCSLHLRLTNQTYFDPVNTTMSSSMESMRINSSNWPMSTHVHGAEIRPTFDGNPLSWISNNPVRKVGLGAFSTKDDWYYNKFQQSPEEKVKLLPPKFTLHDSSGNQVINFKVNRYPNRQNPGTLWFHDHSMRLTAYNVGGGLSGFYLLRHPDVEDKLMGELQAQQRFVMLNSKNITGLTDLSTNTVYRFRFLNGNYGGANSVRYTFGYGGCGPNGPVGPIVNFTLIGTDSSLFNKGLDDQQHFVISNGERVELLIVFSDHYNITTLSICGDKIDVPKSANEHSKLQSNRPVSGPKSIFNINNIRLQSRTDSVINESSIKNLTFPSVAYVNLTDPAYEQKIAVRRMRPLIPAGKALTIHGRSDFHSGHSENPKIGDVEDWFIINTYTNRQHPIHVHLINFQVVKQYNLRMFNENCSLYALDFYATAIKQAVKNSTANHTDVDDLYKAAFASGKANYTILCANYANIGGMINLADALASIYPENVKDQNKISGLNVLKDCTAEDDNNLKDYGMSCKDGGSLYIQNPKGKPHSRSFYGRWKDTAFVETLKVFQYRIRWTKSDYKQERDKSNYFNVPSDQLREYPGYVYHCHILGHEDNEMMRPIMLQLPDGVIPNSTCSQVKWIDKVACINGKNTH